jgi:hypothetical protein
MDRAAGTCSGVIKINKRGEDVYYFYSKIWTVRYFSASGGTAADGWQVTYWLYPSYLSPFKFNGQPPACTGGPYNSDRLLPRRPKQP